MSKVNKKTENFHLTSETSNKTFIHVKLTDSFLHKLQNHKGDGQLSFKLHGPNDGVFSLRQNGKSENYNFSLSNMDPDGPNGSYECVKETKTKNKRFASSLGQISLKMQILAKEDSYKSTKEKIVAVDIKQKKSCTKQLPGPASRITRKRIQTNVQTVIAPATRILRHQDSGYASAARSKPIRARIIHKIALKPHYRPDLLVKLMSEGITDEEKAAYQGIMDDVTTSKKGKLCTIKDEVWEEIQDDWPLYSPEEADIVHRLKLRFVDKKPDVDMLNMQLAKGEKTFSSNLNVSKEITSALQEKMLASSSKRSRRSIASENMEDVESLNMNKEKIFVAQGKLLPSATSKMKTRSRKSDNILKNVFKGNNKRTENKRLSNALEELEKPGSSMQVDNVSSAETSDDSTIKNGTAKTSSDNHKNSKSPLKIKTAKRDSSECDLDSPSTSQSCRKSVISPLTNQKSVARNALPEGGKAIASNTQSSAEISISRKRSLEKTDPQVLSAGDPEAPTQSVDATMSEVAGPSATIESGRSCAFNFFESICKQSTMEGDVPDGGADFPSFEEIYHSYVDPTEEPIHALRNVDHLNIQSANVNFHPKRYVVQYYSMLYHECAEVCARVNKLRNMLRILRGVYYSITDDSLSKQEVFKRAHDIVVPLSSNEEFIEDNRRLKEMIRELEELRPIVQRIHEEPSDT